VNQLSDTGSSDPTPITLVIYRELRIGLLVIMVMLGAAVIVERRSATRWQYALSEYYYTSAHSIFIAALLALAALFFVYKGSSDTEDALLTLAGLCALVAALVPQDWPELFGNRDLPGDYPVRALITPNVVAVVVALALGWSLMWRPHLRNNTRQTRSPGGTLSLYFLRLIVVLGLYALIFRKDWIYKYAHGAAGVLMLLAFIATVFCAAYVAGQEDVKSPYRRFYRWIAVLMLVTLIAIVTLHLVYREWNWIIAIESILVLEFAAYWVVQTIELWNTPDLRHVHEAARNRLAERRTTLGLTGLRSELREAMNEPAGQRLLPLL
jgi:hypothetical protein